MGLRGCGYGCHDVINHIIILKISKQFNTMSYFISKKIKSNFEECITKVIETLKIEGFEVLTKTNLQEIFNEKLNVTVEKYIILGACNPSNIFKAYMRENKVGTFFACNVVVQELDDNIVEVSTVDPIVLMLTINNEKLMPVGAWYKT